MSWKTELGFTLIELLIVIAFIGFLGLFAAGIWILIHFIQKFW